MGWFEVDVGVKKLSAVSDLLVLGCGVVFLVRALCFIMVGVGFRTVSFCLAIVSYNARLPRLGSLPLQQRNNVCLPF